MKRRAQVCVTNVIMQFMQFSPGGGLGSGGGGGGRRTHNIPKGLGGFEMGAPPQDNLLSIDRVLLLLLHSSPTARAMHG